MINIKIYGINFNSLAGFYDEVEEKLTKNLDWKIGRNLDAFNDVLRGGFGVHDYKEPIIIKWINSSKSKSDLGWNETIKYIERKLKTCHPSNRDDVKADLEDAKKGHGKTLFEIIIEIIEEHKHITFELK